MMVTCCFTLLTAELHARRRTKLIGDVVYHPNRIPILFGALED